MTAKECINDVKSRLEEILMVLEMTPADYIEMMLKKHPDNNVLNEDSIWAYRTGDIEAQIIRALITFDTYEKNKEDMA